ncbi:MAG: hypothetical protein AB9873_17735 [Syntrophobacteraceae bacterium]
MKRVIALPTFLTLAIFVSLACFSLSNSSFYCFYAQKMQTPIFSGFLTIGGFLLSLKTFILIKLKEGLYDNQVYRERLMKLSHLNPNQKLSFYGPLSRLGQFLVYCVLGALLTSVFQFTIGFIRNDIAAAFCISFASGTLSLVILAWWELRGNLKEWFDILEEQAHREEQEKREVK